MDAARCNEQSDSDSRLKFSFYLARRDALMFNGTN
jgi:hypothetical protein